MVIIIVSSLRKMGVRSLSHGGNKLFLVPLWLYRLTHILFSCITLHLILTPHLLTFNSFLRILRPHLFIHQANDRATWQ